MGNHAMVFQPIILIRAVWFYWHEIIETCIFIPLQLILKRTVSTFISPTSPLMKLHKWDEIAVSQFKPTHWHLHFCLFDRMVFLMCTMIRFNSDAEYGFKTQGEKTFGIFQQLSINITDSAVTTMRLHSSQHHVCVCV